MLTKALLLGLSTGPFCLAYCLPALIPLMCAGADGSRRRTAMVRRLGTFSLGRLVAYLGFGALVGWLGGRTEHPLLAKVSGGGLILLALLMIVYGLSTSFPRHGSCSRLGKLLPVRGLSFGLGFFTGLNVCPPFLMAAGYVFTLGRASEGLAFFGVYFLVTTLWLTPALMLGAAARVAELRWVAQLSAMLAGLLFLWMGLGMLAGAPA